VETKDSRLILESKGERNMVERIERTQLESLMTARQVADFLQVNVCTVGRWSRRGALRFYRVGGRGDMRYRLEDILRYLEESSTGTGESNVAERLRSGKGFDL
jgi:excisionase family DNA binding protein